MINKEVYLKTIAENLALLSREVSILNAEVRGDTAC